ncbi:hypothetical protein [Gordonia sp. MP11Mi]|uniref:Uncharacterized protein n=1 Tax=Gordonia sp. MP11Mi TaxID=3022769 RepID=A0AA97D0H4_9ACTN
MGTVWTDIESTLARIDSMNAGAAAADAAEIRRIVAAAQAVAARLSAAFASGGVLAGASADASTVSGTALATLVDASVTGLQTGASALDDASAALAASIGHRERIARLLGVGTMPQIRIAVESTLQGLMTGAYNVPMSSSTARVVVLPSASSNRPAAPTSGTLGTVGNASYPGGADTVDTVRRSDTAATGPGDVATGTAHAGNGSEQTGSTHDPLNSAGGPPVPDVDRSQATSTTSVGGRTGSDPAGSGPSPSGAVAGTPTATRAAGGPASTSPIGSGVLVPGVLAPGVLTTGLPISAGGPTSSLTSPMRAPGAAGTSPAGQTSSGPAASAGSSAAARASSASPAMGPGAVRRKDDDEHSSAAYLRSTREGELLLGTAPLVTPAVLPPPVAAVADIDNDAAVAAGADVDQELDPTL